MVYLTQENRKKLKEEFKETLRISFIRILDNMFRDTNSITIRFENLDQKEITEIGNKVVELINQTQNGKVKEVVVR